MIGESQTLQSAKSLPLHKATWTVLNTYTKQLHASLGCLKVHLESQADLATHCTFANPTVITFKKHFYYTNHAQRLGIVHVQLLVNQKSGQKYFLRCLD